MNSHPFCNCIHTDLDNMSKCLQTRCHIKMLLSEGKSSNHETRGVPLPSLKETVVASLVSKKPQCHEGLMLFNHYSREFWEENLSVQLMRPWHETNLADMFLNDIVWIYIAKIRRIWNREGTDTSLCWLLNRKVRERSSDV